MTEKQQNYKDQKCGKNQRSIGFVPWVVDSVDPEISYNLLTAKDSSGIMAMI